MPSKERYIKAEQRAERMAAAEAYLRANYHEKTIRECAEHLGVNYTTVRDWAKKWGLGGKHWTKRQKKHIAKVYSTCDEKTLQKIADERGTSRDAVRAVAHRLGVKRSSEASSKRCEKIGKSNRGRRKYSKDLVNALKVYYPTHSKKECAERFGIKESAVQYIVSLYGIRRKRGWSQKQPRAFNLTDEQQRIIRERFATTRTEELAALLGLGYFKVLRAAHRMGLAKASDFSESMSAIAVSKRQHYRIKGSTKFKPGSIEAEERDRWMREHWAVKPDEQCARHFGVNPRTIRRWAQRLGLRKDAETAWTRRVIRLVPTPEQMNYYGAYIAEHYPTEPAKEIAKVLGIGATTVCRYAKRLGIKKSEYMEQKRHGGSPVRPVAQLDPETLEVIKVWGSIGEAKKAVGSTNIETAIKKLRKSKGFCWCDPDKVEDFKLSLQQKPKRQKRQPSSASDIVAKNEQFKEDMKKLTPVTARYIEQKKKSALANCTDEELWHELERRGWEGDLTRRQVVTLGINK